MNYLQSALHWNLVQTACLLLLLTFVVGCGCESSSNGDPNNKGLSSISVLSERLESATQPEGTPDIKTGTISGTLMYLADADRPWIYGESYLNNNEEKQDEKQISLLSGAVVCLSNRALSKSKQENKSPKTWVMDQVSHQFTPEVLSIQTGDSIQFKNSDKVIHNVNASGSFDKFNLTTQIETSETRIFHKADNERSVIGIRCNFHSQMFAWIYVFSHPYHQVADSNGHFEFHNVPAGEYDLVVIHPSGGLKSKDRIAVTENKKLVIIKTISADDLLKKSSQ